MIIVSAADAAYLRSLAQLLASLVRHHDPARFRCAVYDLGLTEPQRAALSSRFPFVELCRFNFDSYPAFARLRERPLNTNAWKPQIVRDVLAAAPGVVIWLDSATVALEPLDPIVQWCERTGLYTPFGGTATIAELTHPDTLAALGADRALGCLRQRASGVLGFDARHTRVRSLVDAWAEACLVERIVVPAGATLANHRFDQSVLNVLLAQLPGLELTDDELDISSARPTALVRTRNKLPRFVPFWMDPLARFWFAAYRAGDVGLQRIRRQRRGTDPSSAAAARETETATGKFR